MRRPGLAVQHSWLTRFAVSVWLVTQLSILGAVPVTLLAHDRAAEAPACTCTHTGHDQCPMHHPRSKSECECRNTTDPASATLVSLLGPIAVLPDAIAQLSDPPITQLPNSRMSGFTAALAAPDGPPPRA